jgi:molybdopterin-guanine dinucleotide biosynthesis protein A
MPFLNLALLRYLVQLSPGFDAVVPKIKGEIEPLHAIYSKNCLAPIKQQIEQGKLKVREFLNKVKVRYIEDEEIGRLDSQHLSFFNINTFADLDRAKTLYRELEMQTGKEIWAEL